MDGFELLRWLRSHSQHSVIPIIVMSSSGEPRDIRRAYELGANCFFVKPSGLEQLVRLMQLTFEFWNHCERPENNGS
jgi:two-component system, response regulator